jgi:hypothetical protein
MPDIFSLREALLSEVEPGTTRCGMERVNINSVINDLASADGYHPDTAPHDAEWGERFFHITDPDGHELSFAWPLR